MIFPKYIFINDESVVRIQIDNLIRSRMEVGPDKIRPRESSPLYQTQFDASFSTKRISEFNNWLRNDVKYGQIWFYMKDPMDGLRRRFRIVEYGDLKKSGSIVKTTFKVEAYDV